MKLRMSYLAPILVLGLVGGSMAGCASDMNHDDGMMKHDTMMKQDSMKKDDSMMEHDSMKKKEMMDQ